MGVRATLRLPVLVLLLTGLSGAAFAEPPPGGDPPKKLDLYGYIKLDMAHDDSRVNPGNFARWVESESILMDDSQFSMTANQTRLGLKIAAPEKNGVKTTGRVEIDFYGGGASENKSNPLLRHAWVAFAWPERDLEVLAGQGSDIISPLVAPTVNYSAGWWQGNIGYRRAQLRVSKGFGLSENTRLDIAAGPTRTISDSTFVTGSIDSGADAAVPTIQGRTGIEFSRPGGRVIDIGVSGHWGKEDQHITDSMGAIIGHDSVETRSVNLDVRIPISETLLVQAEWFSGDNLYSFLGGIGQKGDFGSSGGWVAATIAAGERWKFNVGGGIDDPEDGELSAADARSRNTAFFANANHALTPDLTLAGELMLLETRYLGQEDGDAMRVQLAVLYSF